MTDIETSVHTKPDSVSILADGSAREQANNAAISAHNDEKSHTKGRNWLFLGTMGISLVLAVAFFTASYQQLSILHEKILSTGNQELVNSIMVPMPAPDVTEGERLAAREQTLKSIQQQALIGLEILALERRHHQANVLLMSRVWIQYMGFIIGMLLALIGSAFVLGKLREPPFETDVTLGLAKFLLSGASPGMFLVSLGTILMIITIVINHTITIVDRPLFVVDRSTNVSSTVAETDPSLPLLTDPYFDPLETNDEQSKGTE